jgi:hypothetical protein
VAVPQFQQDLVNLVTDLAFLDIVNVTLSLLDIINTSAFLDRIDSSPSFYVVNFWLTLALLNIINFKFAFFNVVDFKVLLPFLDIISTSRGRPRK